MRDPSEDARVAVIDRQGTMYLSMVGVAIVAIGATLIAGIDRFYSGMDQSPFVKLDNVPEQEEITGATFTRSAVWFESKGVRCHAWLYLPLAGKEAKEGEGRKAPPVVLMGHGLGAQKDMGLANYGEAFAGRGLACFVIDYRNFGGSDGMPRNLVDPWRHIEDLQAALDFIRSTSVDGKVDPKRIALWGTSFAGGHVLRVAAEDKPPANAEPIRAIVSQVPHLDGRAASKRGIKERGMGGTLKMVAATVGDNLRGVLGFDARYVKLVTNKDDELSIMKLSPEDYADYFAKHPKEYLGGWRNQACARLGARIGLYSPIHVVHKVEAPILFIAGEKDELCPLKTVQEAAAKAPKARLSTHQGAHFDLYLAETLQMILRESGDFLEEFLK